MYDRGMLDTETLRCGYGNRFVDGNGSQAVGTNGDMASCLSRVTLLVSSSPLDD